MASSQLFACIYNGNGLLSLIHASYLSIREEKEKKKVSSLVGRYLLDERYHLSSVTFLKSIGTLVSNQVSAAYDSVSIRQPSS